MTQDLFNIETLAAALKQHRRPVVLNGTVSIPRPYIIEFAGPPSSGKSTAITHVDRFFRDLGFRVYCPQEGAQRVRHIVRTLPEYNVATGLYLLETLLTVASGSQYDLVLLDRGVFDVVCWMEHDCDVGKLPQDMKRNVQNFFLLDVFTSKIDVAFFLLCDSETAIEREYRFDISKKTRGATNPVLINKMIAIYRRIFDELASAYPQIQLMETTKLDGREMIRRIISTIVERLFKTPPVMAYSADYTTMCNAQSDARTR